MCTEWLVMCILFSKLDRETVDLSEQCTRLVRDIHFRKYTEPSLDGTVYSAATEEELLGKTHSFLVRTL